MPAKTHKHPDLDSWLHAWRQAHPDAEAAPLEAAVSLAGGACMDVAVEGEFTSPAHGVIVAETLAELRADAITIAAALVYLACRGSDRVPKAWRDPLGEEAVALVDGLLRVAALRPAGLSADAEGLRRLLLAVVNDVRLVLVILTDQLALLRNVSRAPEDLRRRVARDNAELYAPLANRLGIWQVKWELEDLAFRYREPDTYKRIAKLLDERRADRERFVSQVVSRLESELAGAGIEGRIAGRPKHIYSIWKKMQRKNVGFHELYDVRAVRVLVNSVADCYAVLGIVHGLWQHIPGEFDDYIATPKGNLYRSLHTAVMGPEGRPVEVQIRTFDMHEHAELGVAAHWLYKEGGGRDPGYERKVNWMRQLLEGRGDEALLEEFRSDVAEDRVYVLTPQGRVVDLAAGATVLDFAYHIHTDVGHRCKGAKVNGRIVPLTHRLVTGEQVEILTGKRGEPSRDWMVPALGYLQTGRARQKVRQWFRKADFDRNRDEGREQLERELSRLNLAQSSLEGMPERFNFKSLDDLHAAIGAGEVTPTQVANALEPRLDHRKAERIPVTGRKRRPSDQDVNIEGVGNLLFTLARCCSPVPRDPIVGYVTQGRGVSIHRRDCRNVVRMLREASPRLLEVDWGERPQTLYPVDVVVRAWDRKGLLRDISAVLANEKTPVMSLNSSVDSPSGAADIRFTVQVADIEQLSGLLSRLGALPGVQEANRV